MNENHEKSPDELITLKIIDEIAEDSDLTQRALSERLGIALGLVNTYIKHLVKKGYVRIKQFPKARYKYLITNKGLAEKSRLVYKHLSYYNNFFKTVRNDTLRLFKDLEAKGCRSIAFCGLDEVAEIAFLSLRETKIGFIGFFDSEKSGDFLGFNVFKLEDIKTKVHDKIFISCNKKKKEVYNQLISFGVNKEKLIYLGEMDE